MRTLILLLFVFCGTNTYLSSQTEPNWIDIENLPKLNKYDLEDSVKYNIHELLASGNAIVLDFFASWCKPCIRTAPMMESIWQGYGEGTNNVYVLGLDADNRDSNEKILGLDWGTTYPLISQCEELADTFKVIALPTFYALVPDDSKQKFAGYSTSGYSADLEDNIVSFLTQFGFEKISNPTSIKNVNTAHSELIATPNPTNGPITITIIDHPLSSNFIVNIYNLAGRKIQTLVASDIYQETNNSFNLNMKNFGSGVYIIEVETLERNYTTKLIVN